MRPGLKMSGLRELEHKGVTHSRLEVRTVQVDARESRPTS